MATDAVIDFYYCDNVHLVSIYKRSDAFPKDVHDLVREACLVIERIEKRLYPKEIGRLDWEFVVTKIIWYFINIEYKNDRIKIVTMPTDGDRSFIYRWKIIPDGERYMDNEFSLADCLKIEISAQGTKKNIYSGEFSEFKKTKSFK